MDYSGIYSPITEVELPERRLAQYVVISPEPENDCIARMESWAQRSGLYGFPGYTKQRIGWDFLYVSEQQQALGLRGYVAAFVLPEGFDPGCEVQVATAESGRFARITITDPHANSFEIIPQAYQKLIDYAAERLCGDGCFEEEYDRDGVHYMDVYVPLKE